MREKLVPDGPIKTETIEANIGRTNLMRLSAPNQLAPAKQNLVSIEVDLNGVEEAHPVVALWQASVADRNLGEIVELTRAEDRSIYRGSFSVSGVHSLSNFPKSSVTLFCATNPISVTELQAFESSAGAAA